MRFIGRLWVGSRLRRFLRYRLRGACRFLLGSGLLLLRLFRLRSGLFLHFRRHRLGNGLRLLRLFLLGLRLKFIRLIHAADMDRQILIRGQNRAQTLLPLAFLPLATLLRFLFQKRFFCNLHVGQKLRYGCLRCRNPLQKCACFPVKLFRSVQKTLVCHICSCPRYHLSSNAAFCSFAAFCSAASSAAAC